LRAPPLVACKPLLVIDELAVSKLVDSIAEFNGVYGGIVPAVLSRYIVTD
jgi:hypothetical protein